MSVTNAIPMNSVGCSRVERRADTEIAVWNHRLGLFERRMASRCKYLIYKMFLFEWNTSL